MFQEGRSPEGPLFDAVKVNPDFQRRLEDVKSSRAVERALQRELHTGIEAAWRYLLQAVKLVERKHLSPLTLER